MSIIIRLHKAARTFIKHSMFALKQTINFPEINNTGRKLNVHKTFRRRKCLMYVQFTSCVYGEFVNFKPYWRCINKQSSKGVL